MELEDRPQHQELKHVCKFCRKSFACGRSLGGHMRSHMINDISSDVDGTKLTKKKLPPLSTFLQSNSNSNSCQSPLAKNKTGSNISPGTPGYVLREKPRRSWKFSDNPPTEDCNFGNHGSKPLHLDKSCKDCGKVLVSWKALLNHMKSHCADTVRSTNDLEVEEQKDRDKEKHLQDSSSSATEEHKNSSKKKSSRQKLVMDSQSDNETAAPSKRKRSKRSRTRYMKPANSSSLSFPNNASSSLSQIENEQEEVALCLIMLSRDVGQRGGSNSVAAESSDNNSVSIGANGVSCKTVGVRNSAKIVKEENPKLVGTKPEVSASALAHGECSKNGGAKKQEEEEDEFQFRKISLNGLSEVISDKFSSPTKRKLLDSYDHERKPDALKKLKNLEGEGSHKFECTTCNKLFHSYQALGGHRASHKKIKGCFASKVDSSENSIDTESSHDQVSDSNKLNRSTINDAQADHAGMHSEEKVETSYETKKSKGHECPICFKVFPSGQALGGHKRAHLVGGSELSKATQTVAAQDSVPAIRDFLDLNLPAPAEEESEGLTGFNQWWLGTGHKCEQLLGLISN